MRRRFTTRQIVIFGIILLCLLAGLGLFAKHGGGGEVAQDTGGNPYVTIKGSGAEDLYTFFTYDDYRAVTARIADYIIAQGGTANGTEVDVSDVKPPIRGNGSITTFNLSVPNLQQKNLAVKVDIPTDSSPATFAIEKSSFNVSLHSSSDSTN